MKEVLINKDTGKSNTPPFVNIIGLNVESVQQEYIGKVTSAKIDKTFDILKSITVTKKYLGIFKTSQRIFDFNDIVEILPTKIIVSENLNNVTEQKKATLSFAD